MPLLQHIPLVSSLLWQQFVYLFWHKSLTLKCNLSQITIGLSLETWQGDHKGISHSHWETYKVLFSMTVVEGFVHTPEYCMLTDLKLNGCFTTISLTNHQKLNIEMLLFIIIIIPVQALKTHTDQLMANISMAQAVNPVFQISFSCFSLQAVISGVMQIISLQRRSSVDPSMCIEGHRSLPVSFPVLVLFSFCKFRHL